MRSHARRRFEVGFSVCTLVVAGALMLVPRSPFAQMRPELREAMRLQENLARQFAVVSGVTARDQALANIDRDKVEVAAFDDFDEVPSLQWQVLNRNRSHYSLEKNRGMLTIWTQEGTFSHTFQNYKNLFLIEVPEDTGDNYQITTCVSGFHPREDRNQAGLVCFGDEDNFLLMNYEIFLGRNSFTIVHELAGRYVPLQHTGVEQGLHKFWLRITKWGKRYVFSKSVDGKHFVIVRVLTWTGPDLKRVGLTAKNGSGVSAPEVEAAFEFFELAAIPPDALPQPALPANATDQSGTGPYTLRPEALQIPPNLQRCAKNMQTLYTALKKHEAANGTLPVHLSELVPRYLPASALICPVQRIARAPREQDPNLPCSYGYQYSDAPQPSDPNETYRAFKDRERQTFGDLVPLVRCYHPNDQILNLSFDGRVYMSDTVRWQQMLVRREK